jgi:hypothetical protein
MSLYYVEIGLYVHSDTSDGAVDTVISELNRNKDEYSAMIHVEEIE